MSTSLLVTAMQMLKDDIGAKLAHLLTKASRDISLMFAYEGVVTSFLKA